MKYIALLSVLLVGLSAQADLPDYEILDCRGKHSFSNATLYLDSTRYVKGSNFSAAVGASLVYNYSGTMGMTCTGMIKGADIDVACVGFYNGQKDDVAYVEFKTLEDGSYKAIWKTSKWYDSIQIETICERKIDKHRRN